MVQIGEQKKMTVREVAEALGKDESTIRKIGKGLFPSSFENGVRSLLTEAQVTAIKLNLGKNSELPKTSLEKQLLIRQAMILQNEIIEGLQVQLEQANEQLALAGPKVDFYDQVADAKDAIDMRSVAAVLNIPNMGRNNLFDKLRDIGILDQENCPYRRYQDAGYFRVIITKYTDSYGETHVNKKTLVYPRGLDYIRKVVSK